MERSSLAALVVAVALIAGCGQAGTSESTNRERKPTAEAAQRASSEHREASSEQQEPPRRLRSVWLTLDGYSSAQTLGILMAQKRGYFTDVGFSVGYGTPEKPKRPVRYVSDGTADLGVAQLPQVVLAKQKGAPITVIGSLVPRPTAALIWLRKSGIDDIADLKGRTVAIPGVPFQEALLKVVLARAGLSIQDVELEVVDYNLLSALVQGRADAIFGGSWNLEGAVLRSRNLDPVIRPVGSLGVPGYDELVVIARTRRAVRHPRFMRGFMAAVVRGATAAMADPDAAQKVAFSDPEHNPQLSRKSTEAEVQATLPLLSRTGYVSPARATRLVEWMHEAGLIRREPRAAGFLTNRYLRPPLEPSKAAGS